MKTNDAPVPADCLEKLDDAMVRVAKRACDDPRFAASGLVIGAAERSTTVGRTLLVSMTWPSGCRREFAVDSEQEVQALSDGTLDDVLYGRLVAVAMEAYKMVEA